MQMDKLIEEVRQFGGNVWTQFTAVGHGWEAIMLKNVTISDDEFIALSKSFPDAPPPPPAVMNELKARGMVDEPEEIAAQPEQEQSAEPTPSRPLTEAEMLRNRLHAHADRTAERGERRRRR